MKSANVLLAFVFMISLSAVCSGVAGNDVDLKKLKDGSYALLVRSESSADFSVATKKWHEVAKSTCKPIDYKVGFVKESPAGPGDAYMVDKRTGKGSFNQVPSSVYGAFICRPNS